MERTDSGPKYGPKGPNDKGGWPTISTQKRTYAVGVEMPEPRPMSETNKRRVERVRNKNYMLREQFMGRENPEREASKGEKLEKVKPLPPYWSKVRAAAPTHAVLKVCSTPSPVTPLPTRFGA